MTITDSIGQQSDYVFKFNGYKFQLFTQSHGLQDLQDTKLSLKTIFASKFGSSSDEFTDSASVPDYL